MASPARAPASYPAQIAVSRALPLLWQASATATAAGITTVAKCIIEGLCKSSKSSVCEAAPLTRAALTGSTRLLPPSNTVLTPVPHIFKAVSRKMRAGSSCAPRSATPSQSSRHCLAISTACGGNLSNSISAVNFAS